MAYQKKNLTPEQRSEIARKAALARKTHGGGRPKGALGSKPKVVRKQITATGEAFEILRIAAFHRRISLCEFMTMIAQSVKAQNPELFAQFAPKK